MKKERTRQWDFLAITAIVLAVAGLAVYALPAPTGDVYRVNMRYQGEQGCLPGDIQLSTYSNDGGYFTSYTCDKGQPFSPDRIPLAGVLGVAALFLLVLRLRPVTTRQNR
jgi:hypothetical protein